ncbi:MAG: hypothetical protein AAGI07_10035 [Bacteroidota bacterium]
MKPIFLFLFFIVLIKSSLYAQKTDFSGNYTNGQINLTLNADEHDKVSGNISSNEGNFVLQANIFNGNNISGTYNYFGQSISFSGFLKENQLTISSEGQTFIFQKNGTSSQQNFNNLPESGDNQIDGMQTQAEWGVSYLSPSGWNSQMVDGVLFFVSPDQKYIILLVPDDKSKSIADLQSLAQQGLVEGNTRLIPKGRINNFNQDGISLALEGPFNGIQALGYAIGRLSSYQIGAFVIGVAASTDYNSNFQQQIESFAKNLRFSPPQIATDESGSVADWGVYMKGRKLTYMKSSTGFYMKINIYLCSDGSFAYSDNSGSFGNGSVVADGNFSGRWQAHGKGNTGTLVLNFNNGNSKTYTTELNEEGLFLNGTRYFRADNDYCR